MRHAIVSGETPVEYHSEFAVDENGFQWPLRSLNTAEKKAHGIYEIAFDFSVPVGHARVGMELALVGDDVIEQVMAVSWAMKDETGDFTGGIPADFTADTHWPS